MSRHVHRSSAAAAFLTLCAAVTALCSAAAQAGSYGQVLDYHKISQTEGGFIGPLEDWDHFGTSIDCPGDLDGDGVVDLIVGAPGRWSGITGHGAVWILLLNPHELLETEGAVKAEYKIAEGVGGFNEILDDGDWFGWSVKYLGDLDGNGPYIHALAVGAYGDDDDTNALIDTGAVYILFLDAQFTVQHYVKISNDYPETGCPPLDWYDWFGYSMDTIGYFDDDDVIDLAVGAAGNNDGGGRPGALFLLFLNGEGPNPGTVKDYQKISQTEGGAPPTAGQEAQFGSAVADIGDRNGDGITDLAVGVRRNHLGGADSQKGAIFILYLNPDGTVFDSLRIRDGEGGLPEGLIQNGDNFGRSIASLDDLDGDGFGDIAVGAIGWDPLLSGTVWNLLLGEDEHVLPDGVTEIGDNTGGFGPLDAEDCFGVSITSIGDFNGDGVTDIAVGAKYDDDGGTNRGAIYLLYLTGDCNLNGIPDEIDMADCDGELWCGDCDGNGILDACDPDYNADGVIDACDCNDNGQLDSVDIDTGVSFDYNLNDVPDECEEGFSGEAFWANPDGGLFGSFLNWDPDTPGPDNTAVFDLDAQYTVDFFNPYAYDYTNRRLRMHRGDVTFQLDGHYYLLNALLETAVVVGDGPDDDAHLTLVDGTVEAYTGIIAQNAGSAGAVTVSGDQASWLLEGDLIVGWEGSGELVIENGAGVQGVDGTLGSRPGSSALGLVTGAGSRWDVLFSLRIDHGALLVESGATVSAWFGSIFLYQDGLLGGDGTIEGEVINFGGLMPGLSPGALLIDGDYVQIGQAPGFGQASGTLTIDIAGPTPGLEHDVLDVTGLATLGGGLVIDLLGEYDPPAGQTFDILNAGSIEGSFDVALLPGLLDGKFMRYQTGPGAKGGGVTILVDHLESLFGFGDPESFNLEGEPSAVALGDLDNVNGPDLAITWPHPDDPEADGFLLVLLNAGTDNEGNWLGFAEGAQMTVGRGPSSVALADFDLDGLLDAAVSNAGDDSVMVLFNDVNDPGTFGTVLEIPTGAAPSALAVADFDGDELVDIAVSNAGDDTVYIFLNQGGRGFQHAATVPVGTDPGVLEPEDLDLDDAIDFLVINRGDGTISIVFNAGDGTFDPPLTIPVDGRPVDARAADFDGNTFADIVVTNELGDTVSIVVNEGGRQFTPAANLPVGDAPRSVTTIDLEPDGDQDVAIIAGDDEGLRLVQVLRNDTTGEGGLIFAAAEMYDVGGTPLFVLSGDVDGDTAGDLIVVSTSDAASAGTRHGRQESALNVLLNAFIDCPADFDGDGDVDTADLLFLLGAWGTPDGDVDGDSDTDTADLLLLLAAWGECP